MNATTVAAPRFNPFVVRGEISKGAHVARVEAAMLRAAHATLDGVGFTQVVAPTLTTLSGACGDPGTLIPVRVRGAEDYFLRQTSQLHLEPLMRELGAVYSIGKSFRAERRNSERHRLECTLIEVEAAGWTLPEMMELMERLAVEMLHAAAERASASLDALGVKPSRLLQIDAPFARMTYDEAIVALQRAGHFIEWGEDMSNSHEQALAAMVGGPLFITHYPLEQRFFTMKVCRRDPRVVECCDLILPGVGEVMGASETEADPDILHQKMVSSRSVRQMLDLGGSATGYDWYIEMHSEASAPQAGFGMGFERLVRYACNLESVREAITTF
jgi:asparaginyl-tRNA synthetase